MSLYVRLSTNFYSHVKTLRLKAVLGNDAFWIPPRLWTYAAEHQPNGDLSGYSAEEIAAVISYSGDAQAMLEALLKARFLDANPLRIHAWAEHNGFHKVFSDRAEKAAAARWEKDRKRKAEEAERLGQDMTVHEMNRDEMRQALPQAMLKHETYHEHSRIALHWLNEKSGKHFRELDCNLGVISQRLREPGVSLDGVKLMIERQCKLWMGTSQQEYLRPETLFGKSKFDNYYASNNQPINSTNKPNPRNVGVIIGPTNYGEAAKRKMERQALEAANRGESQA